MNAWLNPELIKSEGAWRFTQERVGREKQQRSRSGRETEQSGGALTRWETRLCDSHNTDLE